MDSKILIVDDEMHLARILQFTLERAGYDVVTAFDGEEAIEKVKQENPDLIILDLMLPLIDGYKVCNIIKDNDSTRNLPIIILTARDLALEKLEEPVKADLLMQKPFNTGDLIEKISGLLAGRSK